MIRYSTAATHRGALIQARLNATPTTVATQTVASSTSPDGRGNTSSAIGVYVPAIKTKIIEWSSRRIQPLARGVHVMRW